MRVWKRFAGVLAALTLAVSLVTTASAQQFYSYNMNASYADEIADMLDLIYTQTFSIISADDALAYIEHFLYDSDFSAINGGRYPYTNASGYWAGKAVSDGTYYQVVSATGCFSYCKFVSQVIYGTSGVRRDLGERTGQITGSGLKAFLQQYAQAGEHIRVDSKHSVTYISGTEDGFYYLDYAGDQNPCILLRFSTYDNFAAYCNQLYKAVWLYDADPAVNTGESAQAKNIQPAEWLLDYAQAAEELGLTQSGSSLSYDDNLTLAEAVTLVARANSLLTVGGVEFQAESGEAWYTPYATYLKQNAILDDDLDYLAQATRDEYVSLMFSAVPSDMKLQKLNRSVDFADLLDSSNHRAVSKFYQAGILTGVQEKDGLYFYPDSLITRGEAIALITRLVLPDLRMAVD